MQKQSLCIFMISGMFLISATLNAQTWNPRVRLTYNDGSSRSPCVAVGPNKVIHVVWNDTLTFGHYEILHKRSTNGGTVWSYTKRITWNSDDSVFPEIAVDSNNHIHLVWQDYSFGNYEVLYKKSTNIGISWSQTTRMTWNSEGSIHPVIAIDTNDNIYVVWGNGYAGNSEIFCRKSTDGGASWSALKRLTWSTDISTDPAIAIDSNDNVCIAWEETKGGDDEIMFKRSLDGGNTWSSPVRITYNSGESQSPTLAANSSSGIFLAWNDDTPGNDEIFFKKSTNGGGTWSNPLRSTYTTFLSFEPVLSVDGSNAVHLIWLDRTPGNDEVFYKSSTNGGNSWSSPTRLTWSALSQFASGPDMFSDKDNNIYIVYAEDLVLGGPEIYFRKGK